MEAAEFEQIVNGKLPVGWAAEVPKWTRADKPMSTRVAGGAALNALAKRIPNIIGGSADLNPSTETAEANITFDATDDTGAVLVIPPAEVTVGPSQRVTLDVAETEPVVRGQTASGSFKPATLSNGVRTMVPTHIVAGTRIVVLTADGSYVERAKD